MTLESPRLPWARGRVWGSMEWHNVYSTCVLDHREKGHASQGLELTRGGCSFHQGAREGSRVRRDRREKFPEVVNTWTNVEAPEGFSGPRKWHGLYGELMHHDPQPSARCPAQAQGPVNVSSNYTGRSSPFTTHKIKGRQKQRKVGSPALGGTRDMGSAVNSASLSC